MLQVETFYPENELLKKYVAYYYFLKTEDNFASAYYVFPHTFQSLNIHQQARFTINGHHVIAESDPGIDYAIAVQGRIEKPFSVQLKGRLDQATIVFKALGLNPFIKPSFRQVAPEPLQLFTGWNNNTGYPVFLHSLYTAPNKEERVRIIENWLLSVYSPFKEELILQKAIDLLTDFQQELSIDKIAMAIGVNNRSFHRLFQQHVGIAPVKFRKIARFRHSLTNKLFNDSFNKLTQIGYASNFYDQSYFNKIYHQLAGASPGSFFHSIDKLADENMVLRFINK